MTDHDPIAMQREQLDLLRAFLAANAPPPPPTPEQLAEAQAAAEADRAWVARSRAAQVAHEQRMVNLAALTLRQTVAQESIADSLRILAGRP